MSYEQVVFVDVPHFGATFGLASHFTAAFFARNTKFSYTQLASPGEENGTIPLSSHKKYVDWKPHAISTTPEQESLLRHSSFAVTKSLTCFPCFLHSIFSFFSKYFGGVCTQ